MTLRIIPQNTYISQIPLIGSFYSKFDLDVKKYGFIKALKINMDKVGIKIKTIKNFQTDKILKEKTVILISNHPYTVEPLFLLSSLPNRKNFYMIADSQFLNQGENIDHYLIPVYVKHHYLGKIKIRNRFLHAFSNNYCLSLEKAREKNRQSIYLASQKLSQGNMIIIFPNFAGRKDWLPGISYLIKQYEGKQDLYFVRSYLKNTKKIDIFRFIPILNKIMPQIEVIFDKPQKINHLLTKEPKEIVNILEENYNDWVKTIE